jgi:4-oxalocrotonate tautomerase family enzyme
MPFVQVDWLEGRDEKTKEKLFSGIAKAFEDVGVKKENLQIVIRDVSNSNWAVGDTPYSKIVRK